MNPNVPSYNIFNRMLNWSQKDWSKVSGFDQVCRNYISNKADIEASRVGEESIVFYINNPSVH